MSGICGIFEHDSVIRLSGKRRIVRRMSRTLAHRGSQEDCYCMNDRIAMCRRHAISGSFTERPPGPADERPGIRALCAGVLYNVHDILARLYGESTDYRSLDDDFVVERLYERYKGQCLDHVDGEFSVAIWDGLESKLVLGTDHLGTKPLFYYSDGHVCVFASEIKAIMASGIVPVEVHVPAINDFLSFGYVPHPETMFKGLFRVEPGTCIVLDSHGVTKLPYASFGFRDGEQQEERYYVEKFTELLKKAVRKRIDVSVPIGAYLSGGLDSSGICAVMSALGSKAFRAFTVGFNEDQYDEIPFARLVAERYGLDWTSRLLKPSKVISLFPKMVAVLDAPFMDTSVFPSYIAAEAASDAVGVVMTGDGPDQLLAGSERHMDLQNAILSDRWYWKILRRSGLKHVLRRAPLVGGQGGFTGRVVRGFYNRSLGFAERVYEPRGATIFVKRYMYSRDMMAVDKRYNTLRNVLPRLSCVRSRHPIEQTLCFDMCFYLHDNLMPKVERTCAAHGLECRSPFLDRDLVRFIEEVPLTYRIRGSESKYLLRQAFAKMIPEQLFCREKQGFAMPRDEWFRNELQGYIRDVVLDRRCLKRGYFREEAMRGVLEEFFAPKRPCYRFIGGLVASLVTLELWHRIYIDGGTAVDGPELVQDGSSLTKSDLESGS